jgi:catechol 2,3-dioxygenase-like lactoylglutathione lyase family enzyme
MRNDIGFTHIALSAKNINASIDFYARYSKMAVVHDRIDAATGIRVVWLSDQTRPFVLVLIQSEQPETILKPSAHLGVGCANKAEIDQLCEQARAEGILAKEPVDSGYPVGYWALINDPDGHTLELSFGQEIGLTVEESKNPDIV